MLRYLWSLFVPYDTASEAAASFIGEVGDSVCISGLIEHVDGRKTGDSEENRVKKGKKVDIGHVPRGEQCPDLDRRRSGLFIEFGASESDPLFVSFSCYIWQPLFLVQGDHTSYPPT